jgi:hypothetical protein
LYKGAYKLKSVVTEMEFFMATQRRTFGILIIQLALAIYLTVTGLFLVAPAVGGSISSEEIKAVTNAFGSISKILNVVIGLLLLACGIMFLIKAFGIDFGKADDIVKYVTIILWIIVTIVTLAAAAKTDFGKGGTIFHWLLVLAKNCLIIGGAMTIKNGK